MQGTEQWLVHEHTSLEVQLGKFHSAVDLMNWTMMRDEFLHLTSMLDYHMGMEEQVLFPAFDEAVTEVHRATKRLRADHMEIIELLGDIADIIRDEDVTIIKESLAQLELLMLRHHEKEEDIFLPMASHILFGQREAITQKLNDYKGPEAKREWGL